MSALAAVARAADPDLRPYARPEPGPGPFEGVGGDSAFVLEAVREGYEMHYGEPRAFRLSMEEDHRLLAGDALYALGLSRLAERGDLAAVAELADLISSCARVQIERRPELAADLWIAGARRLAGEDSRGSAAALAEALGPAA
jgi:hypothetical protein